MTKNVWEGDLIRLRALEPRDWPVFHALDEDSESERAIDRVYPRRSVARYTDPQAFGALSEREGDNARWVYETLRGVVVGTIDTHHCDQLHRTFEYGIATLREHWGKGYAADAIKVVLRYMFEERGYQKVNAGVFAYNEQSRRLHEKLGFVLEARWRRVQYAAGEYHDQLLFGLTAEEFAEKYG